MKRLLAWLLAMACAGAAAAAQTAPAQRVVTLGGTVTEIVYALGQGGRLVGDDLSSLYPQAATQLPRIGYYRAVPVEGVLALEPDLVLASEQAGPPDAIERLKAVGVRVAVVSDQASVQSLHARIRAIAQALDAVPEGERLAAQLDAELARAEALPASGARALLLMNRTGTPLGAGRDTAADLLLRLSGLANALAGQEGYKPLSAEALGALAPEVIVVTAASLAASGGLEKLRTQPGIAATPAAQRQCIVVMDDLLALGTGPRLPQAIRQLKETPCVAGHGTPPAR
ncbi:putative hemin-binding periplasmic protein HmuT [Bordetella bronchiseptica F2]|nr:putative hemin-binding periplasmic protein HmuT [Bordetella bronchiseptica 00-P-2730]KDC19445.1 putative hemin-binding periplasmic protein HmuT [Bordetella bronchiseptica F-1]KDC28683.1 putative hemin-binding periplasmic protein HmuT [Bordetella bronchiseptica F2]KDE00304.1 putative hemin-binding periplasmic protein HmuT [Bordetella bronchiseptica SBL-F6116]